MDDYETVGDPDAPYVATKQDERRQRAAAATREHVLRMHFHEIVSGESMGRAMNHTHDDDEPGHVHGDLEELGPSLGSSPPPAVAANLARVRETLLKSEPTPPHMLMRWRVRLFCGHVAEATAHVSHRRVGAALSSLRCPECGLEPAVIVAARALGTLAARPKAQATRQSASRSSVERRLARARAEVARLEAQLESDDS